MLWRPPRLVWLRLVWLLLLPLLLPKRLLPPLLHLLRRAHSAGSRHGGGDGGPHTSGEAGVRVSLPYEVGGGGRERDRGGE